MRPIDADVVLQGIEELRRSPWYNEGNLQHAPMASPNYLKYLARKEALDVVRDLCVKNAPTIETKPVQQWISVKDRLPEKSGDVLVCSRGYCLPVHYSQRWKAFNASDYDDGTKHAINSVTHWMPLPELPEENDDEHL